MKTILIAFICVLSMNVATASAADCKTVSEHGTRLTVVKGGNVSCARATQIAGRFLAGAGKRHAGSHGLANTYWTLEGWRCARGTDGEWANCSRRKATVRAVVSSVLRFNREVKNCEKDQTNYPGNVRKYCEESVKSRTKEEVVESQSEAELKEKYSACVKREVANEPILDPDEGQEHRQVRAELTCNEIENQPNAP